MRFLLRFLQRFHQQPEEPTREEREHRARVDRAWDEVFVRFKDWPATFVEMVAEEVKPRLVPVTFTTRMRTR